jgi:hypothetical protein
MRFFLVACSLLLAASSLRAQPVPPSGSAPTVFITPHVGYSGSSLGEVAALHGEIVRTYTGLGIDLPDAQSPSGSLTVGLDVLIRATPSQHHGLGLRYTGSTASSLYGDYAGTLDVVSRVRAFVFDAVSYYNLGNGGTFAGARAGFVYGRMSTREAIDLQDLGDSFSEIRGSGIGYSLEGFGGVGFDAGPFPITLQLGYRYAVVDRLKGSVRSDQGRTSGELPLSLDFSGLSGSVSVRFGVR